MGPRLRRWLTVPELRDLDVDHPEAARRRRELLRARRGLAAIYRSWYDRVAGALPPPPGRVLELGSGGGFLAERVPEAITSELMPLPGVDLRLDAAALPVRPGSLRALVLIEVFHHLPRPRALLAEAARAVRPGGVVAMVEPWVTAWSRRVYRLHPEPFDPDAPAWEAAPGGPLSGANIALPWIVFARDRRRFESEFPCWRLETVEPFLPFGYLVTGGLSLRAGAVRWTAPLVRRLERIGGLDRRLGMFAWIVLRRTAAGSGAGTERCAGSPASPVSTPPASSNG